MELKDRLLSVCLFGVNAIILVAVTSWQNVLPFAAPLLATSALFSSLPSVERNSLWKIPLSYTLVILIVLIAKSFAIPLLVILGFSFSFLFLFHLSHPPVYGLMLFLFLHSFEPGKTVLFPFLSLVVVANSLGLKEWVSSRKMM